MVPGSGGGFIKIHFAVEGGAEVNRRLATYGAKIEDLSDAWEQVGEDLLADFAMNFQTEGGVFGDWDALADATVLDRIRHGYGGEGPMLVRTGYLKDSVTKKGALDNIFAVSANSLTLGTEDAIAGYHQFGTSKMPAREVIGLSWTAQSRIVDTLNTYIQALARQQGLMP